MQETKVRSLGQEDSLEKGMATHFNIFVGEFHRQSSLASYSPLGCKKSDTTKKLTLHFTHLTTVSSYMCLMMKLEFLFFFSFFFFLFVVNFVIHWNKTAMGLHVVFFPILRKYSSKTLFSIKNKDSHVMHMMINQNFS